MNLVLARVDDRLIHGQVAIACRDATGARRMILANGEAAADALQRQLYRAAVPPSVELEILDLQEAARRLRELDARGDQVPTLLVTESPQDMLALVEAGAPIRSVNLGGLHHHQGSRERWSGFFLDPEQEQAVRTLLARGIEVIAQTVPRSPAVDVGRQWERK